MFGHHEIAELEREWRNARSNRRRREILWDALEVAFHHASPANRKAALLYVPDQLRTRWRLNALGQDLMRLRGTEQWKIAVAAEDGSLRKVAAMYGESYSTVRRWKAIYLDQANGKAPQVEWIRSTIQFLNRHFVELDSLVFHSLPTNGKTASVSTR